MPGTTDVYGIDFPCASEDITLDSLITYSSDVESAISTIDAVATKAKFRPAARVTAASLPYVVGVALIPAFTTEIIDTNNMFTLAAPTVFTVNTAGTYLISFQSSVNTSGVPTSHKAEILVNGSPVSTVKCGIGFAGASPPGALTLSAVAKLAIGNTISVRITVTGTVNDTAFPRMSATLISYGGS